MCLLLLLATTAAAAAVLLLDAAQLFAQGLAQVGLHLVVAPHDEEEEDGPEGFLDEFDENED